MNGDYTTQEGPRCLVTGATGYIGGRLVPELLTAGYRVRCLARSPGKLRDHPWADDAEIVRGDVTDDASTGAALRDVDVAYYLVHALGTGKDFEETDRRAATVFARQARAAGVRRIVYLGGLTPAGVPERDLSPHLRSRAEVGRVLLASGVPTAVLRAAVILGSGSASFEMLRYLTERLPVMVTPSWVHTRIQPVAVRDVLRALVGSAGMPAEVNRTFDIGGPEVLTYRDMMLRYARVAGLPRRLMLPVPLLTPSLSSHWVGLVTPVPASIARPLAESLRHEVVCHEHDIARYVPDPPGHPLGFDGRPAHGAAAARVDAGPAPTASLPALRRGRPAGGSRTPRGRPSRVRPARPAAAGEPLHSPPGTPHVPGERQARGGTGLRPQDDGPRPEPPYRRRQGLCRDGRAEHPDVHPPLAQSRVQGLQRQGVLFAGHTGQQHRPGVVRPRWLRGPGECPAQGGGHMPGQQVLDLHVPVA
ncbi:hypothetical protein SGLAM104S_01153 [Streptomyces glaucescens]